MIKNLPANAEDERDALSIPGSGKSPEEGNGKSTPVFLPGKFYAQRNLVGYSPWGHKISEATEHTQSLLNNSSGLSTLKK